MSVADDSKTQGERHEEHADQKQQHAFLDVLCIPTRPKISQAAWRVSQ